MPTMMTQNYTTEQEAFWAGAFGAGYIERNRDPRQLAGNLAFFAEILKPLPEIRSVLEIGANIGLNLRALSLLLPGARLSAVEINDQAVAALREWGGVHEIHHESILDWEPAQPVDFVLSKTVLIHLCPDHLATVYRKLHASSSRFICIAEYFSRNPVEVEYRGHQGKLFKRDFAGEMLDRFPDLVLHSTGFASLRSVNFPQDDVTWHLLEKRR
jgi:spore coat polysaccharide biosynthesis protein SpsF